MFRNYVICFLRLRRRRNLINRFIGEIVEEDGESDDCSRRFFAFADKLLNRDDACLNPIMIQLYCKRSYQSSDMND